MLSNKLNSLAFCDRRYLKPRFCGKHSAQTEEKKKRKLHNEELHNLHSSSSSDQGK
jgi:hypothetical protein